MKKVLLIICMLIPTLSFSQVFFNSNGYSESMTNDDFPEPYKEYTNFRLEKNKITIGNFTYSIKKVLKEKSLWNNSIIVEVSLITLTGIDSDRYLVNPQSVYDNFEVGYDSNDKIKYITAHRMKMAEVDGSKKYVKYVNTSNFQKSEEAPSIKW